MAGKYCTSRATGEPMRYAEDWHSERWTLLDAFRNWPDNLAANLAWGGALCEAWDHAINEAEDHHLYHMHGYRLEGCWWPGCGRTAHL